MDYYTFNTIEALFWIVLGLSAYALCNLKDRQYMQLAIYTSIVFVMFGLSDIAEIFYGSFLEPGLTWLFAWKIANVLAIIYVLSWYVFLRVRGRV